MSQAVKLSAQSNNNGRSILYYVIFFLVAQLLRPIFTSSRRTFCFTVHLFQTVYLCCRAIFVYLFLPDYLRHKRSKAMSNSTQRLNLRHKRSNYPLSTTITVGLLYYVIFFTGAQLLSPISGIWHHSAERSALPSPFFSRYCYFVGRFTIYLTCRAIICRFIDLWFVGRFFVGGSIFYIFVVSLFWPDSILSRHTVGAHPDSILPH